jgi:hypothetical protein
VTQEHDKRLTNNKNNLFSLSGDIQKIYKSFENLSTHICSLQATKTNLDDFKNLKSVVWEDLNKMKLSIEGVKVDLRATDNYITKFKPLNEFKQMVKVLDYVMTEKKERERLVQYVL